MMSRDKEYQDLVTVSVLITMADGTSLGGNIQRPRSKSLLEFMNNPVAFIEVERLDGSRACVAKSTLRSIEIYEAPRAANLAQEAQRFEHFEPHEVLGVPKGASRETVREAYLKKQRLYHPDRYTGTELPPEVSDYINSIARRINLAYSMLNERGKAAH